MRRYNRGDFRGLHEGGDFRSFHERRFRNYEHRQRGRVFFGIVVAIIGIGLLLHTLGVLPYLSFDICWPVLMILLGLLIGIKSAFRSVASWILIFIGILNLTPEFMFMGHPSRDFAWPGLVIISGLVIAFRPRRKDCFPGRPMAASVTTESNLNIDVTFGGKKEVVTTKDFKGGIVSVTFAGCELNLVQADFTTPDVVLDFRVSFGGVELIVPAHWEVQNEIQPSFGSVEDERTIINTAAGEQKKIIILRGSCSFGSIEIKSY